ncbi:RPA family protein [Haloplanus pelagicus]|uniref:RPA family protein n=1 Tax=Haloplanus pelagicus TaxID=2949995 RepID=UPI00203CFAD1|nr:hypothetical protein [Haloplanus sp. HW8-1]
MSAGDDAGPGRREVAHRLFAAEFDDATVSYAESDEERAPKYVVTPTGARVNRLFAVGVLTEVESVNEDVLRARVVDPTGAFVSYAGQYQPDAAAFFERASSPSFVALTGKARTFEPDDGDRIYTSVRPESVAEVDAETRDRWTVSAAEATLRRIDAMADAKSLDAEGDALEAALLDRGYDPSLAAGIPIALDRYGTTTAYLDALREVALDALAVVAGDRDAVRSLDRAPADAGTSSLGPLPAAMTADSIDDEAQTVDATAAGTDEGERTAGSEATAPDVEGTPADGASAGDADAAADEPDADDSTPTAAESAGGAPDDSTPTAAESAGGAPGDSTVVEESDELGDFDDDDDLYELDEEERREVEESFDVGFESAAEVDDPGEAGIDVPGPEEVAEAAEATGESAAADDEGGAVDDGAESEAEESDAEKAAADVDLEAAAVDAMAALDDGDGAARDDVVAAVVDEYGADPGEVADAIEDALMSGKCYEPSEDSLKAI